MLQVLHVLGEEPRGSAMIDWLRWHGHAPSQRKMASDLRLAPGLERQGLHVMLMRLGKHLRHRHAQGLGELLDNPDRRILKLALQPLTKVRSTSASRARRS